MVNSHGWLAMPWEKEQQTFPSDESVTELQTAVFGTYSKDDSDLHN